MAWRDGSLSSFPGSADQFVIKRPFQQGANDREAASHFNHYLDACYNIEIFAQNRLGGGLLSYTSIVSSGFAFSGSGLSLSTTVITTGLSATGLVFSIPLTIPAWFGTNPFFDSTFAPAYTTYLNPTVTGDPLRGVAAGAIPDSYLNSLLAQPQAYTMIQPTGGRNFNLVVKLLAPMNYGVDFSGQLYDGFDRNASNYQFGDNWIVNAGAGPVFADAYQAGSMANGFLRLKPLYSSGPAAAGIMRVANTVLPATTTDQEVEFELVARSGALTQRRCGPMVRFQGSAASGSFYGLALNVNYTSAQASLIKVIGADLTTADRVNSNTWYTSIGSIVNLGSLFTVRTSAVQGSPVSYRLTANGTSITVSEKIGAGSWSVIASAIDSGIASGSPGFFSKRVPNYQHNNNSYHSLDAVYVRTLVPGLPLTPGSGYQLATRLVFTKVGLAQYLDVGTYT